MGTTTTIAARQVFRWAVRATTTFSPSLSGRCLLRPRSLLCRFSSSSSSSQTPPLSTRHKPTVGPVPGDPAPALSLQSLLDLGFTEPQAEQVHQAVSRVRGGSRQSVSTLAVLLSLGLNPTSVLKLLLKCPEVCSVKESLLRQRIAHLRTLGLVEGSLQRMVAYHPPILTVPVKTIKYMVAFLRDKCLFTGLQVTDLLRDSPSIVQQDPEQVQYMFQYVYFRLGVKQAEMIKSKLFRFPLDEIRCRHTFLERRGLYQTPDKKGQTTIENPTLENILHSHQDSFVTEMAKATAEEYEVFKRLMAREGPEEEREYGSTEVDVSDSEDELEEEEEEDEVEEVREHWRSYRKGRKS